MDTIETAGGQTVAQNGRDAAEVAGDYPDETYAAKQLNIFNTNTLKL